MNIVSFYRVVSPASGSTTECITTTCRGCCWPSRLLVGTRADDPRQHAQPRTAHAKPPGRLCEVISITCDLITGLRQHADNLQRTRASDQMPAGHFPGRQKSSPAVAKLQRRREVDHGIAWRGGCCDLGRDRKRSAATGPIGQGARLIGSRSRTRMRLPRPGSWNGEPGLVADRMGRGTKRGWRH